MATFNNPPLAYGQSQPLVEVMPMVQEFAGVPTTSTRGVLGQMLLNSLAPGNIYMLTGIVAGLAQWTLVAGGAGNFNSLTVATTITAGTSIAAGTTITAGTSITATAGNITASLGNIVATAGNITATAGVVNGGSVVSENNVYAAGDDGLGEAGSTSFTNLVDETQGAGALTLLSTNGNAGTNTGFMQFYVGTDVVWVPYFADIAP